MIGFQGVDEAPLCSTPFMFWEYLSNTLTVEQAILGGKVFQINMNHNLTLSQDQEGAQGYYIDSTIALNHTLDVNGVYNIGISSAIVLSSSQPVTPVYTVVIDHPIFLSDSIQANNVYSIEICDNIPLIQRLGWVIEIEMSNVLNITMEELEGLYSDLVLQHDLSTNMDDLTCINPFGSPADKDLSNHIVFAQSLSGQFIYACEMASNIEILATVARR